MVHLGTRAAGGAGLVMAEATAVRQEGRISPWDQGLWSDAHVDALRPITAFISSQGSVPAVQLAHAGRKASTAAPWIGTGLISEGDGGWQMVAPSALPYDENLGMPKELSTQEISEIVRAFGDAAARAIDGGYRVIELHLAHGYLGCEFLSPLSNKRGDEYGGSLKNRARFSLKTVQAVRRAIPDSMPLFVRVSATEYMDGGWGVDECVELCRWLRDEGVDLIDCSSGGNAPDQDLKPYPGYQVQFAERIRKEADIMTGAVGLITTAEQAEAILAQEQADVVLLARELLRRPYWALHARSELDGDVSDWPDQYARAA